MLRMPGNQDTKAVVRAASRMRRAGSAKHEGQAIVEFGVIFMVLFFLFSGIADFGLMLNAWISLSNSSAEIARLASVGNPPYLLTPQVQSLTVIGSTGPATMQMSIRIKCAYPAGYGPDNLPPYTLTCPDYAASDVWADVDVASSTPTNKYPLKAPYTTYTYPNTVPPLAPPAPFGGELMKVTLSIPQFQIVTPIVRAAFGNHGSVPISTQAVLRSEGIYFQ